MSAWRLPCSSVSKHRSGYERAAVPWHVRFAQEAKPGTAVARLDVLSECDHEP